LLEVLEFCFAFHSGKNVSMSSQDSPATVKPDERQRSDADLDLPIRGRF
jgi:hypothetical protein